MALKSMTKNDSNHDPVKITIKTEGNNNPKTRHVPKRQQKTAHCVAQAKDLYKKKIPRILEKSKRGRKKEELEGIY